ncbi:RecQ-mediated genome instability protein 1 [Diplodia seriata]|uniref:RecQ-mediated genome instability protein 1 n=1 Tax=Diplodia seriata TaxID=420778 RepID=A0A1S8BKR8_9PEZI|nr:RecQ-mediated genome instability protein 1 [Diplodia seriata]
MPPPPTSTPTSTPTVTTAPTLTADLTTHLTARGLPPSPHWLQHAVLPSLRPNTPLAAARQTALFRLLAADIATQPSPLAHSPASNRLPANVATSGAAVKEIVVPGPVAVQVLDVEDVGRSRWSQVEALEARARGEGTKGREVVRLVAAENGDEGGDAGNGGGGGGGGGTARTTAAADAGGGRVGPHKLLLVDAAGTRVYGFELAAVPGVDVERMGIGAKLVLRNAVVARGVVLLEPKTATCLGGKVEALDKPWREGRLARLREAARMEEGER